MTIDYKRWTDVPAKPGLSTNLTVQIVNFTHCFEKLSQKMQFFPNYRTWSLTIA
jgi:hypothetical protein